MAWKDIAKSIKSGADAVASVAKDSVSNKNSVVNDNINDIDISVGGDTGKDFAHASPVSSENHSATFAEAAVKAAKESQVQVVKDKAVNAVDSVKEHVGRVVDFAPEEPTNDSDSGYDLG